MFLNSFPAFTKLQSHFVDFTIHHPSICEAQGLLIQYSYMSAIFWLSSIGHFMWKVFRKIRAMDTRQKVRLGFQDPQYRKYALFSWGLPLCVSIITIIMQHLPPHLTKGMVTPQIGELTCFLGQDWPTLIYLYMFNAPVSVRN